MDFRMVKRPTFVVLQRHVFLNSGLLPQFGLSGTGRNYRKDKHAPQAWIETEGADGGSDDAAARRNTYISNDADWVTFDGAVVSTSPDQIAIAPW